MITDEQLKALQNFKPGDKLTLEVTREELLAIGKQAHRAGERQAARTVYDRLHQLDPSNIELQHFFGLLLCQTSEPERGLAMLEASVRSPSATAGWWSNYGNILRILRRQNDAIDAYKEAISRDPASAETYNNLGVVQKDKYNNDVAVACFQKALEIDPDYAAAWSNLGNLLVTIDRMEEGVHALLKSVALSKTKDPSERRMLAFAYTALGEKEKAAAVYRDLLAEDPANPIALHHLAWIAGETPVRASDAYVQSVFDSFADTFDQKLEHLEYAAPKLVVREVGELFGPARGDRSIADAGCGTGLCAPGLRPYAARLVGVDLSPNMIEKAKARGGYDALEVGELTSFFQTASERFDLIVSADTLCYFGDLAPPIAAFRRSLAPGGGVIFSVELLPADSADPYLLLNHGRYAHREDYVRRTLEAAGFCNAAVRQETLRLELGKKVAGLIVRATVGPPN
jgi:predicted TPR repeat methyltransferase